MSDTVIGALSAIGGVFVGVLLGFVRDRAAWRRENAGFAATMTAELWDLIWFDMEGPGPTYSQFDVHLWKLRAHLELLGVSPATVDNLEEAARQCRRESHHNYQRGDIDEETGKVMAWIDSSTTDRLAQAVNSTIKELRSPRRLPWRG